MCPASLPFLNQFCLKLLMLYSTHSQKQLTKAAESTKQDAVFKIHITISQQIRCPGKNRIVVFAVTFSQQQYLGDELHLFH